MANGKGNGNGNDGRINRFGEHHSGTIRLVNTVLAGALTALVVGIFTTQRTQTNKIGANMTSKNSPLLEALASDDELFDAVFCAHVIEHVTDTLAFLGAVHDVTAPGGVLYIATPDAGRCACHGRSGPGRSSGRPSISAGSPSPHSEHCSSGPASRAPGRSFASSPGCA